MKSWTEIKVNLQIGEKGHKWKALSVCSDVSMSHKSCECKWYWLGKTDDFSSEDSLNGPFNLIFIQLVQISNEKSL